MATGTRKSATKAAETTDYSHTSSDDDLLLLL